jgi:hypothetical protein
VTPAGPGFPEVAAWIRLADEPGNRVGSFSEHRFSNDGMRGLPLNLIIESFGAFGGLRAVDPHRRLRHASAAGQFNRFVMGLR